MHPDDEEARGCVLPFALEHGAATVRQRRGRVSGGRGFQPPLHRVKQNVFHGAEAPAKRFITNGLSRTTGNRERREMEVWNNSGRDLPDYTPIGAALGVPIGGRRDSQLAPGKGPTKAIRAHPRFWPISRA